MSMSAFAPLRSGTPAWEPPLHAPYYQPETPFPSSQHGQYGVYPSYQPGQYNAQHSEHARFQPKPIPPNPYLNSSPATGMGTAIAAPVSQQPETRDPSKSRRATAPQLSLGEEPRRRGREPGQQQRRGREEAVDEKRVSLKEIYDKKINKWALIAKALSKEFNQHFTQNDCHDRWDSHKKKTKGEMRVIGS